MDSSKRWEYCSCPGTTPAPTTTETPTEIPTITSECEDIGEYCQHWSQTGECSKNPSYMHVNCKLSCHVCSEVRPRPVSSSKPATTTKQPTTRPSTSTSNANNIWEVGTEDCWYKCGSSSGKCSFCGNEGYCCSGYKLQDNQGCSNSMIFAIK